MNAGAGRSAVMTGFLIPNVLKALERLGGITSA